MKSREKKKTQKKKKKPKNKKQEQLKKRRLKKKRARGEETPQLFLLHFRRTKKRMESATRQIVE